MLERKGVQRADLEHQKEFVGTHGKTRKSIK